VIAVAAVIGTACLITGVVIGVGLTFGFLRYLDRSYQKGRR
jgi:hypothetical protein